VVNVVRESSVHTWKAHVHNTPRMVSDLGIFISVLIEDGDVVRKILPELIGQLVKPYSSQESEQQEVGLYCIVGRFSLTHFSRPPLVLQQN